MSSNETPFENSTHSRDTAKQRDAFESEWRAGREPSIEDHLESVSAGERSSLLRDLMELDVEYRRKQGEQPSLGDYLPRFQEDSAELSAWFAEQERRDSSADTANMSPTVNADRKSSDTVPATPAKAVGGQFRDYELLSEIARGGMGVVYRARQISLDRVVALKMILSGDFASDEEIQRFQAEARAAGALDHPNIVPIYEVGEDQGRHFFSMGFVDGLGLNTKLKEGPLSPQESAELVMTVALAVQYAHDKGIVHRDLKPANILLQEHAASAELRSAKSTVVGSRTTPLGSTTRGGSVASTRRFTPKITDFGLAKNIAADSGMTATGQIMGTPSFMPPEQATGDLSAIGPRSDVYSLGAILYCAITGRPPFQAANMVETIRHVLEQDPVSPRQLNPSVDRDLNTICLKCLEKSPDRRYQSARELADDLARYLRHEPIVARSIGRAQRAVRWCRRRPAIASLLGLVVVVACAGVAGIAWQWRKAESAREVAQENYERAEENFQKAEEKKRELTAALIEVNEQKTRGDLNLADSQDVVRRFLTDVGRNSELLSGLPGTQKLREKLLNRAVEHYRKFIRQNKGAELTSQLAAAYRELGLAQMILGQDVAAEDALTESVRLWQKMRKSLSDNSQNSQGLAVALMTLGRAKAAQGRPVDAIREFQRAIELVEPTLNSTVLGESSRKTIAVCAGNLGTELQRLGRTTEAIAQYHTSAEHWESLFKRYPNASDVAHSLATIRTNLGQLYSRTGRLKEATKHQKLAVASLQKLVGQHPQILEYSDSLVVAANNLALAQERSGQIADAIRRLQETAQLLNRRVRENPAVPLYREHSLAVSTNLGRLRRITGQFQQALQLYREAIPSARRLAADAPKIPDHKNRLAALLNNAGLTLEKLGKVTEAKKNYLESNALRETLLKSHPDQPQFAEELIVGYMNIGNLLEDERQIPQAEQEFKKGLELAKKLVALDPKFPKYRDRLAACYSSLAQISTARRNYAEALRRYKLAIEIGEKLSAADAGAADLQQSLARRYNNLGNVYRRMNNPASAIPPMLKAIAIWKKLLAAQPGVAAFQRELLNNYANLAEIALTQRRLNDAGRHADDAVATARLLVKHHPAVPGYRRTLAKLIELQGRISMGLGRKDVVIVKYKQSIAIRGDLVRQFPTSWELVADLASSYHDLANVSLNLNLLDSAREANVRLITLRLQLIEKNYQRQYNRVQLGGTRVNLAIVNAESGRFDEALDELQQAEKLLAIAVKAMPSDRTANRYFRNARSLTGKVLNARAWMAAVGPAATAATGKQAVADATRACELAGWKSDLYLTTLAAACARVGDFKQARAHLETAIKLAPQTNAGIKKVLQKHFQSDQPFSLTPPARKQPVRAKRPKN